MKLPFLVIAIGAWSALAGEDLSVVKVELVCAQAAPCKEVSPGTSIKVTVSADATDDKAVVLYVDGKQMTGPQGALKKGSKEVTLEIDKNAANATSGLAPLFVMTASHSVSIGPTGGTPFPGARPLIFAASETPGVDGYFVRRWAGMKEKCQENVDGKDFPEDCWARLGDQIELKVADQAMAAFKASDEIVMWLDGRPMPGVTATRNGPERGQTTLVFVWDQRLPSLPDSKESWLRVLRRPWKESVFVLSAGTLTGPPLPSKLQKFPIQRMSECGWYLWLFFAVAPAILLLIFGEKLMREEAGWYAGETGGVREGETDDGAGAVKKKKPAFSLARTQMVAWTYLVAVSFIGIWMVTFNKDVLNTKILLLLGIATGTTLGAVVVDTSKKEQAAKVLAANGNKPPTATGTTTTPAPAPETKTLENPAVSDAVAVQTTPTSEGFWLDLISDRNGPSIARFQMLIFSLILMVIFVFETLNTLVMPEFSDTLLGLMGISSAGYLAFKVPERKS